MKFKPTSAVITGGASGIGRIMASLLIERGLKKLWIVDRDAAALKAVQEEFVLRFHQEIEIIPVFLDVTNTLEIERWGKTLCATESSIDLLINNAGIVVGKFFSEHRHDEIERTLSVNVGGVMHLTLELLPLLKKSVESRIVTIASATSFMANPKMSVYVASKWAVCGWSESLRIEMQSQSPQIGITTVTPFYINTGMFKGVRSPFIPVLEPHDAARRIVDAIEKRRAWIRIPRIIHLLPILVAILPMRVFQLIVGRGLRIYETMSGFQGRQS